MVSESRVRDWLNLLDYNVQPGRFHHMTAPVYRLRRPVERVADAKESDDGKCTTPAANYRGWNPLASCYLLVARREIFTVTPIRPKFRRRAQLVGSLINPTTRNSA